MHVPEPVCVVFATWCVVLLSASLTPATRTQPMQKHYPRQLGKPLHLRRGMDGSCGVSPQSLRHEDPSVAPATARATSPVKQALGSQVLVAQVLMLCPL